MPPFADFAEAEDGALRCLLCPHACRVAAGAAGLCGTRSNSNGRMSLPYYGHVSSLAVDPIEKKPLYHFYPGKTILSAGFLGCNLRCPFCQNYSISQDLGASARFVSPESLVAQAKASGSIGIAYTYSEPLIHFEYVLESAKLARAAGLKNVAVTNGHLNLEPARELLPFIDAANIDLKSFNPETYRNTLGGDLEAVKAFIELARGLTHIEITTLVVPRMNDGMDEIEELSRWIASLSRDIPFHLSAYRPAWKSQVPSTSLLTMAEALDVARKRLRFVYPGNVSSLSSDTRCPVCGAVMVHRRGYEVEIQEMEGNRCTRCGARIPMINP